MPEVERAKVVRIIGRLNIGGPAIQAINLTSRLSERFPTSLVTGLESKHEGSFLWLAETLGVRPIVLPSLGREISILHDLRTTLSVWRFLRKEQPRIVHTHTAKAGFVGRLAAVLAGVPIVIHTFHGHVFHSYFGRLKSSFFVGLERLLAKRTTRIIAISEGQKTELLRYGVGTSSQIQVIPLGFDLDPFLGTDSDLEKRKNLGIPEGILVVGLVARLTAIKNIPLFLKAAAILSENHRQIRFLIVGDGELRSALEEEARALGIADYVVFSGWQKEMAPIYRLMDVFALTSNNEGTPASLIEAMASGCPVVSTDVGGVPDIVKSGGNGFLVKRGDLEGLVKAISLLLEDAGLRNRMGEEGKAKALRQFGIDRLVRDIDGLYSKLISGETSRLDNPYVPAKAR